MGEAHLTVTIEIDPAAEPVSGTVHLGTAGDKDFTGWMGLMAIVDDLVIQERGRASETDSGAGGSG